jgi:hypothetical protein
MLASAGDRIPDRRDHLAAAHVQLCLAMDGAGAEKDVDALARRCRKAQGAASISARLARASEQMVGPSILAATAEMGSGVARRSRGEPRLDDVDIERGERQATRSLPSTSIEKPGACSPSRRVVSKMRTSTISGGLLEGGFVADVPDAVDAAELAREHVDRPARDRRARPAGPVTRAARRAARTWRPCGCGNRAARPRPIMRSTAPSTASNSTKIRSLLGEALIILLHHLNIGAVGRHQRPDILERVDPGVDRGSVRATVSRTLDRGRHFGPAIDRERLDAERPRDFGKSGLS